MVNIYHKLDLTSTDFVQTKFDESSLTTLIGAVSEMQTAGVCIGRCEY